MTTRRELLQHAAGGLGLLGAYLCGQDAAAAATLHHPARARRLICLYLNGGFSHIDSFDPKPALDRLHGTPFPGEWKTDGKAGNLMRSPYAFRRAGQSGAPVSECFPRVAGVIDEFCIVRSMYTDFPIHPPSLYMMSCGDRNVGHPSVGSWLCYGLGALNRNLPAYVALSPGAPEGGPQLWSAGFLPGAHQATHIDNRETDPRKLVRFLPDEDTAPVEQRARVELASRLNRVHLAAHPGGGDALEASIAAMETAFAMQAEALEAFDLARETPATRARYGDTEFGRACLLARRLAERDVRVVSVFYGENAPWDHHDDVFLMREMAPAADAAIAALMTDLEARGLLRDTLVVITTEFGRTPTVQIGGPVPIAGGRDHNPEGFCTLLAGGGVKAGTIHGATDELGARAVDKRVHVHDLHATMLRLMGLDHKRLTYRHSGRDYRLTDTAGVVVEDIIA